MAIVKVSNEAIRYLSAKALYDSDENCKKIMNIITYKKRGAGFITLLEEPYYRDSNSPRVLNIISEQIGSLIGNNWYKLVQDDLGIKAILGVLSYEHIDKDSLGYLYETTDNVLLSNLKAKEIIYVITNN